MNGNLQSIPYAVTEWNNCLDPSDHKLYKFGKLYRARQVLRSLMTDRNTINEHS